MHIKPFLYGNIAKYIGTGSEEGDIHQWTVFVRPYRNEAMSLYVKKVHFRLHNGYVKPNRAVKKPPFEITGTGSNEFEVVIKIFYQDINERPLILHHSLKLHHTPGVNNGTVLGADGQLVIAEHHEEMIFRNPTRMMHEILSLIEPFARGAWDNDPDAEEKHARALQNILDTKERVQSEIGEIKRRLTVTKLIIGRFRHVLGRTNAYGTEN